MSLCYWKILSRKINMIKYEKAPYQQGYELALNNQKYKNPYRGENESADAEDFRRGFDNAKEEKLQ